MNDLFKIGGMKLFEDWVDKTENWLPEDGTVHYYGKIVSKKEADYFLKALLNTIEWKMMKR